MEPYYTNVGSKYLDFTKRMTVLRELFEECNILVSQKSNEKCPGDILDTANNSSRREYLNKHASNFIEFCRANNLLPSIDKLFAFMRFGSPVGMFPAADTQFYMYFCDYEPIETHLSLNQDEFTEYKWLAIDEAMSMYEHDQIPIFFPQMIILSTLKFMNLNYMQLRS